MTDQSIKMRFVGDANQYIPGVPQRDLTAEDFDQLSTAQRKLVLDSGLYELVATPRKKDFPKEIEE